MPLASGWNGDDPVRLSGDAGPGEEGPGEDKLGIAG